MTSRVRASLERLAHNAGPIAVLGVFLLLAVVVYAVLRIDAQSKTIVSLQQAQLESAKTGRATQLQVAGLISQIASFTDPNSPITKAQQAKVASYLSSLAAAVQQSNDDQTRKIAQMFEACRSLPCATSAIDRILAEPVPVPTFAGAAVTPTPARAPAPASLILPTPRATSTPRPTPAPTLTPFLVVQCPIVCPPTR